MTQDYKQILADIGWPTDVLVVDFETYADQEYSLRKMSTIEYINNDKFEVLGLGMKRGECPSEFLSGEYLYKHPSLFSELDQYTIICQNAKFDTTILQTKYGTTPKYIVDTLDLARHFDSQMKHGVKELATMFKLTPKGDTKQFMGLHYADMLIEQKWALSRYCLNDCEIEFNLFKILLPYVSNPAIEIPLMRHTLKMYLEPKIVLDVKAARNLRCKMLVELEYILQDLGYDKKQISGNKSFAKLLAELLPNGETVPTKTGKKGIIPAFAKDDEGFQELLVHPSEGVRNLCLARQAVKSWPGHIKRITSLISQSQASGGLLRVPLHYYGGHTGRWSGGEGINLQNLGGAGRTGSGISPLIGQVRSLLTAPDGNIFVIADSAQIEARVLAWLAGQDDLVEAFRRGEDVYSMAATTLFGVPVRKPRDDDPPDIARVLKIRRGFGKDEILGAGYGMGAKKFYKRCLVNRDLRPLFDSGEYTFAFIERLIKTYRTTYQMIPKFWNDVEQAFRWVIKYPHQIRQVGLLEFSNDNTTVLIKLPSGRCLRYRHCRTAKTDGYDTIQWHYGHLWGGSITENIVQAVARDLLGYWILRCEHSLYRFPVVLHSHDEIVNVVPKENAEYDLGAILRVMKSAPGWADGLPLDAEGELSERYKK